MEMKMKTSVKNMKIALVILAIAITIAVVLVPAVLPILGMVYVGTLWVKVIKSLFTKL